MFLLICLPRKLPLVGKLLFATLQVSEGISLYFNWKFILNEIFNRNSLPGGKLSGIK